MLEDAWDAAPEGALTLRETLRTLEKEIGALIATGQIQSVGKNSANQSYAFGTGALTLPQIAEGWRDLINLYDRSAAVLTTAAATVNDATVYAEMTARCFPVYSTRPNLLPLREVCA